jgi:hypothetical protein
VTMDGSTKTEKKILAPQPSGGRREKKSEPSAPKSQPVGGSIVARLVKCGRPHCRCARGQLHGPYLYIRWQKDGHRRKKYIKPSELEAVKARLAAYRRPKERVRTGRDQCMGLLRLMSSETSERRSEIRALRRGNEK